MSKRQPSRAVRARRPTERPVRMARESGRQSYRDNAQMVAVISPTYLDSKYTKAEWTAYFKQDADGTHGLILPMRVVDCDPPKLLGTHVWFDLFGCTEKEAREVLLQAAPLAVEVLTYAAYLAPEAIPRDLLERYIAEKLPPEEPAKAADAQRGRSGACMVRRSRAAG